MMTRKTKETVRFLKKARNLLLDMGVSMKPANDERVKQLFEIATGIPGKIEKEYNLDKQELAFVAYIMASFICSASADAIEKAEEAAKHEH